MLLNSFLLFRYAGGIVGPSSLFTALVSNNELHKVGPFSRWDTDAHYSPAGGVAKVASRFGTFVHSTFDFDPEAFGLSVNEASLMDPQSRVLLEETVTAFHGAGKLESLLKSITLVLFCRLHGSFLIRCAGYSTKELLGSPTGVYVGCIWLEYGELLAAAGNPAGAYMVTGNGLAFMSGRVSYTLGLIGPCVPTNTACSSSLVAYHLAAKGILLGDCTLATASGVNSLLVPTSASAAMTQVHALSPDGRCKAFGAEADGYGRGEGYTALIIEPAGRSSRPLALVAGSAVNQDGRSSGLTAPHGPSQQALISAAMREAGTAVLGYVASHGTGTPLGDPIETGALRKAVVAQGAATAGASFTVGAIKTLTGHLEGTAGLAGLLLAQTQLEQRYAHGLRYREINAYVANSFGGWAVPYRLPIQSAPSGKALACLQCDMQKAVAD